MRVVCFFLFFRQPYTGAGKKFILNVVQRDLKGDQEALESIV